MPEDDRNKQLVEFGMKLRPCLSRRAISALTYAWTRDIETLEDLLKATAQDLLHIKNCGLLTVAEIAATLDAEGIPHDLRANWPPRLDAHYARFW
jgi:DNA-directed RNA polymerase alpha subunit